MQKTTPPIPAILIASISFYLQARYLHLAALPYTDEGVYAEAGRLMIAGQMPHNDFPLWHLPLLPLLSGLTLKLTGNMYWVRLLFLGLNCSAVIPFYLTCKKIQNNSQAAILAILFYLTYDELLHLDFRFLAIRQLANDLLIWFFYLGVCQKHWKWTPLIQSILCVLSFLLFLPTTLHIFCLSLALSFSESRTQQLQFLKRYILIAIPGLLALFLYFSLIPHSLEQVVFGQLNRAATDRLARLETILHFDKDIYFYILASLGLLYTFFKGKQLRLYALAMIAIVLICTFLSSNFYPHYMSAAAPAFAFGIFGGAVGIYQLCQQWNLRKPQLVSFIICFLLFSYHFSIVFPSLNDEWQNNRQPDYYEIVKALSKTPEPLLAIEPIFAVEADKKMVQTPIEAYFRAPSITKKFTIEDYQNMAAQACTIFLEGKAKDFFPVSIQQQWQQKFHIFKQNRWGIILLTNNPHCDSRIT